MERLPRRQPHPAAIQPGPSSGVSGTAVASSQVIASSNGNNLRDVPITTSSPMPLGTSAAIVANGINSQTIHVGPGPVAGQIVAGSSQTGATSTSQQLATVVSQQQQANVENYQFLLPRLFEPNLTEEELQQLEKERIERYCLKCL